MFCSKCGSKFESDQDLFCSKCGAQRSVVKMTTAVNVHNQEVNKPQVQMPVVEEVKPQEQQPVIEEAKPQMQEVVVEEAKPQMQQPVVEEAKTQVQPTGYTEQPVIKQPEFETAQPPVVPVGFVLDPASGWHYMSKTKQSYNGDYVNEITWFDPKSGRTAIKDYPMTEQQVQAMLNQNRYSQVNTINSKDNSNVQTIQTQKKSKKGLVIAIASILVLAILAVCTWKFEWYKIFGKGDGGNVGAVAVPTSEPTEEPTPTLEPTVTPEATPIPENPLGVLNEDYILIGDQEFLTEDSVLYLESMNLSNSDLESLKYMKNLDTLHLNNNNITDLAPIKEISTLTYLDLSGNDIYNINDIANLVHLESLYLNDTKVSDLTPLASLTELGCLSVKNTGVFDLEPIVGLNSLMYLYLEGAQVEDYSYLDQMPNLYFCDSYAVGGGTTPTPIPGEGSNFTFTEADNLYFNPVTSNYIVTTLTAGYYDELILASFDENDMLVMLRARMDVGYELGDADIESYMDYFNETGISEINVDGSVIYFDYPTDQIDYTYTRDAFIRDLEADQCDIIVDVKN